VHELPGDTSTFLIDALDIVDVGSTLVQIHLWRCIFVGECVLWCECGGSVVGRGVLTWKRTAAEVDTSDISLCQPAEAASIYNDNLSDRIDRQCADRIDRRMCRSKDLR
jgi:hypothetical protein